MRQAVHPGRELDILTPAEAAELLERTFRETVSERVRAAATIVLDATGAGQDEVFTCPAGFEFEARRVLLDLDTAASANVGQVALTGAGVAVEYLRSGRRIEYAQPQANGLFQIPGVQTWGDQQGPYLRNSETFEVRVRGLTANAILTAFVEGIMRRPPPKRDHGRGPAPRS